MQCIKNYSIKFIRAFPSRFKLILTYYKFQFLLLNLVFSALCFQSTACTKGFFGLPELGSKRNPIVFSIENVETKENNKLQNFKQLSTCLELNSGYRVVFESTPDEKAIINSLKRNESYFAFMSTFSYIEASLSQPLTALLVRSEKGAPSTRSVIIGKTSIWKNKLADLGVSLTSKGLNNEAALKILNHDRIAYLSPESDVGFLVPRQLLMQKEIYPAQAVFLGSYSLVLQAISRNYALAGVVSESFLEEKWPNSTPVQPGTFISEYAVLAISRALPGAVVVARNDLPPKISFAVSKGLQDCFKNQYFADSKAVFNGDGFFLANDKMFTFIKELIEFRNSFQRVLSKRE